MLFLLADDDQDILERDRTKNTELEEDKNSTRNPGPTYTEEQQKTDQGFNFKSSFSSHSFHLEGS